MKTFYRLATVGLLVLFLGPGWSGAATSQAKQTQMELFLAPSDSGAYLGVCLKEITDRIAKEKKLPGPEGALVTCIQKESPAARAGLKNGDVIIEWNQLKIYSAKQLSRIVRETPPGRTVHLRIIRKGKQKRLDVKLGRRPHARMMMFDDGDLPAIIESIKEKDRTLEDVLENQEYMEELREQLKEQAEKLKELAEKLKEEMRAMKPRLKRFYPVFPHRLGIRTIALTDQLAEYFGVPGKKGVLIIEVEKGSPAERAGLRAGDVITEVNDEKIDSPMDLMLKWMNQEVATIRLTIVRNRKIKKIAVERTYFDKKEV